MTRGYEAPQGEMEETLAAIWAELLKVERVGRHDNFFELGGHSLLAVQVVSRMQQRAAAWSWRCATCSRSPCCASWRPGGSERAESERCRRSTRCRAGRRAAAVVCAAALWFLAQLEGPARATTCRWPAAPRGAGPRRPACGPWIGIVARHEALRTRFVEVDGQPVQRDRPAATAALPMQEHDLASQRVEQRRAGARLSDEEATAPFDLETGR